MSDAGREGSRPRLTRFVAHLRAGGVVACATETQIGLLADAMNARAVAAVCALKGRPEGAPIALLLPGIDALPQVAEPLVPRAAALAKAHWPGPLTLVVAARPELSPALVQDGRVGVRVPGPSPALTLVQAFGGPLTATSCNRSGQPAAVHAEDARGLFGDSVPVWPADAPGGPPSTVIEVDGAHLRIIRPGAVTVPQP